VWESLCGRRSKALFVMALGARTFVLSGTAANTWVGDSMTNYFHRQLGYYADAHRDRVNSVMHMIGNPILFVAVVLPLSLLPVSVLGVKISAAPLLTIPALILWMAWDIIIGLAIVVTSIPLLFAAGAIAIHVSILWVWVIAVGLFVLGWALQIVGHQLFEGKRPTLLNNPVQMLISPMYMFAKLFVALGLRPDLAAVLQKLSQPTPPNDCIGRSEAG
jgi:uncharacterized membrane protein YGL010W